MRSLHTTCNRDCPDACAMIAHLDQVDGEERVVRLQGDPRHPITRGFLCYRTDQFLARQYSPARLTTPLVRRRGTLAPATWDEALDLCARTLLRIRDESGPAAIFHYRSGGSLGLMKHLSDFLFERFGPVTIKRGDICSGAGDAAQMTDFGDEDANDLDDLENARAVVLWGKNPHTSSPHLLPILHSLRRRGVPIALVDPVSHRGVGLADLYLQPRPGGDLALAFGVARVLFERHLMDPAAASYCDHLREYEALARSRSVEEWARDADVPCASLLALAELYGDHQPAAILVGWGMQRRSNGSAIVRAIDALATVAGNIGVAGGGASFYFKRRGAFDLSFIRGAAAAPRTLSEPRFGEEILAAREPAVRALFVTAGNPVAMLPDSAACARAITSTEFVVVVDSFLTDTARLASVVLPTTTLLEDEDVVGAYGHHYLGSVRPVAARPADVRTDYEIAQALAPRLGLGDLFSATAREWKQRLLGELPLESIERGWVRNPNSPRIAFAGRKFKTSSGRANLLHSLPETPRHDGLLLQALSTPAAQSSQWSPDEPEDCLTALLHPDAVPGIADRDPIWVVSAIGRLAARAQLDPRQRRDVVTVPKGGSLHRGRAANVLIRARLTDDGEGAALYEEAVTIERRIEAVEVADRA